jgi:hypothetical protein
MTFGQVAQGSAGRVAKDEAMPEPRAHRTLVKSPPELWAEVSDAAALARHLDAFGEIRITRLEPETTVAWEGDRGRGTVELEPAGWGTKVTLTADLDVVRNGVAGGLEEPAPFDPEPEPWAQPEPQVEAEPPDQAEAQDRPEPEPPMRRRGFFARLFRRRAARVEATPPPAEPAPPEPPRAPDPPPVAAVPQSAPPEPPPGEPAAGAPLDAARAVGILTGVLDDLGAARHHPFSRG